jgi:hypothetical protein
MRRNLDSEVKPEDLEPGTLRESYEVGRAMARGVRQAQEDNRRLGLPNVVTRDGRLVEEFPDGTVHVVGTPSDTKAPTPSRAK